MCKKEEALIFLLHFICFVCERPVDEVVNSPLPVVASIHRPVYLRKQLPLCLADPAHLLSTLNQWSEMATRLACFCHCNEAKPRPEVSAVRFPNTLCMLEPLPPSQHLPPLFNHTPPFLLKLSEPLWMHSPSCFAALPPPPLPSSVFFPQRNSPSFGLPVCSGEVWDSSWLWVAREKRGENRLRLSGALHEIVK